MSDKLFSNPLSEYIVVKNSVFDYIMPTLSGDAWKVLCVVIRQTLGGTTNILDPATQIWVDMATLMQNSGIPERKVIDRALQECVYASYLVEHSENKKASQPHYALNLNFVMPDLLTEPPVEAEKAPAPKREPKSKSATQKSVSPALPPEKQPAFESLMAFGSKMGTTPDRAQVQKAVAMNTVDAVSAWIELGHGMTNQDKAARFQTVLERLLAGVPPLPLSMLTQDDEYAVPPAPETEAAPETVTTPEAEAAAAPEAAAASEAVAAPPGDATALWDATLEALRPQMRNSLFKWFKSTTVVDLTETTLVVAAPNKRTREWLETGQLASTIQETFASVSGGGIELKFIVQA